MATDVLMPQMGESIAEGTVSKWLKKVGDRVERDEPLLEISTDKVDAEIPSPTAGVLTELLANEGDTVAVNTVVARIGADGDEPKQQSDAPKSEPEPKQETPKQEAAKPEVAAAPQQRPAGGGGHDVVMPQMGESIAEGTVSKWLKKVGDQVERDEPLLEISTDKVDAEIPSPAGGVLTEILAQEGETVAVNAVVARIGGGGAAPVPSPAKEEPAPQPSKKAEAAPRAKAAPSPERKGEVTSLEERRRTKSSPLVRRIAEENNVDISQISGTGISGRVTKNDILEFLQKPRPAAAAGAPAPAARQPERPPAPRPQAFGQSGTREPLSLMRKRIAQHMVQSKATSAHVHTVFEVDFTAVDKLRRQYKDAYAERGVKLTFMPFIVQAVIAGLREFPVLNASMDDTHITYHRDYNIGIAVALDWGLIVPVVKHADELNILGASRAINDLGERARTKKLSPDDVQGGTFTITNPGVFGGLFGLPIINQPQVAILGVGGIKKRPVVMETKDGDFIAIRPMCYFSLGFDHRLIDGAVADQFMARVKSIIESGQFTM
jgi:2-oxoglutarate dehydrogenase E2 component (dihydrolipoamide succinyltransferase)